MAVNLDAAVPADVCTAAAEGGLGAHRESYPPRTPTRPLLGLGIFVVLWAALSAVMAMAAAGSPTLYERTPLEMAAPFLGLTAVFLAGFLVVLLRSPVVSRRARTFRVHVFEHGWVRVWRKGVHVRRFDEVRTLYAGVGEDTAGGVRSPVFHFRITFNDGGQVDLRNYATDMARFGPVLVDRVAAAQLPKALAYFDQGNPVGFGDFTVTEDGVATKRGEVVPWSRIAGVMEQMGHFWLVDAAGTALSPRVPVAEVPNPYTFTRMCRTILNKINS